MGLSFLLQGLKEEEAASKTSGEQMEGEGQFYDVYFLLSQ